jgi:O-antigen biosynthesis protein
MKNISVIITNWNGLNLLKNNFLSVVNNSPEADEIIFSDDCSDDGSISYISEIQKKYPKIKIIKTKYNVGFGKNSNFAVSSSKGKYVVLLNNDILPHPRYISLSLHHFKAPKIFGVGFSELGHENWAKIFWKDGYLQHDRGLDIRFTHISGWVSGGGSIIDKEKFLKLGGFDDIYAPFYSEDLDLGYRAWKSGYTLLWEPKSIIEHKHGSTTSKFSRHFLDYVKERNRLLTVWRNISDPNLLFNNRLAMILRVLSGPNYIKIILAANRQIKTYPPSVVFPKLSDKDIFSKFL